MNEVVRRFFQRKLEYCPRGRVLLAKEIDLKGTFRFHAEFADAARAISNRSIDLRPIMTGRYPLTEAVAAFDAAADRNQSLKIHLDFLT